MKYLKLFVKFKDWTTVSDEDFANVQELHKIGVISDQELAELIKLRKVEQRIIRYNGVGSLDLSLCTLLTGLPAG